MIDNRQLQEEEVLALQAIYDQDFVVDSAQPNTFHFTLRLDHDQVNERSPRLVILDFHVPDSYPCTAMPVYEITSMYCGTHKISDDVRKHINDHLSTMFVPGQVVLFEWIDWLKEFLESTYPEDAQSQSATEPQAEVSQKMQPDASMVATTATTEDELLDCPDIESGEAIIDRKSVFVAHVAPVTSVDQVEVVRRKLLQNKKIAKATHNILAYRIQLDSGTVAQDNDEDGETAAGGEYHDSMEGLYVRIKLTILTFKGRLSHLLEILEVTNVVVIVSRWYGGIQLHADRFKHINNAARQALETFGYLDEPAKAGGKGKKK
ncbi:hypothetical protein INT43_008938 [Umbelopsis isabellina]|uniref:RWD domain-containing protein n=1 Tax=Mortierella isabellina TaxID=91625 RepID=A0A8H7UFQ7_MORIS|nr:hypothetical protein INT43_008938 [Umbelopsis isabellina]